MGYIRLDEQPGEVYHYTHRKNLDSILRDGRIRRMGDRECWFCASLEDTLTLMRATVMMEGKPYYKVGGSIGRYPKFVPEDYVILRLNPRFQKGEWVQWMQEMPPGSPPELLKAAETFSNLKLGFRGDLKFQQNPEVIEVAPLVEAAQTQFLDIFFLSGLDAVCRRAGGGRVRGRNRIPDRTGQYQGRGYQRRQGLYGRGVFYPGAGGTL